MSITSRVLSGVIHACVWSVLPLIPLTYANPEGGTVVAGSAQVAGQGGALTIHQASDRAIIDWQSFSIGPGEVTTFVQPGANASVLNRVLGLEPSSLLGALNANGRVYLLNRNGVLIGAEAQINTRGFVASTLELGPDPEEAESRFLSSGDLLLSGDSAAGVANRGRIDAGIGDVYLIANTVENAGQVRGHSVSLVAADRVTLLESGDPRIAVHARAGATGGGEVGVNNRGTIEAVNAELRAAGGNMYALAIHNEGVVRGTKLVNEGGRIVLRADTGVVKNAGTLDASNPAPGGTGGEVQILGERVGLTGAARVDVSGDAGGGRVLVGGDYQGANPDVPNAKRTWVGPEAVVRADARTTGDGGEVIVWSDEATVFLGSLSARGGEAGGDGGFAEISGKEGLLFEGRVDLRSPQGLNGRLLLDPATVTITGGTDEPDDAELEDGSILDSEAPGATWTISYQKLEEQLVLGEVFITAINAISVNGAIDTRGEPNSASLTFGAPEINLNAPVYLGGGASLLGQQQNVQVNVGPGGLIANGIDVVAPLGTVTLSASEYAEAVTLTKELTLLAPFGTATVQSFVTEGDGILSLGGDLAASELMAISAPLRLVADASLLGPDIILNGPVSGGFGLTLNSAGMTTLGGVLGLNEALASLTTDAAGTTTVLGGEVRTTGAQTYRDAVVLEADAVFRSLEGGDVTFAGSVNSGQGSYALSVETSAVTSFSGAVGNEAWLGSVRTDAPGTTIFNDPAANRVQTVGNQIYEDAIVLGADTTLASDSGDVTFEGSVNGGRALAVQSPGETRFGGAVGVEDPLISLQTDEAGSTTIAGGTILTSGAQTYRDPVVLQGPEGDTVLVGTDIELGTAVRSAQDGVDSLTVAATGTAGLAGAVGDNNQRLANLTTDRSGTTELRGGSVTTTGSQTYGNAVVLDAVGNTTTLTAGGEVTFASTLRSQTDGEEALAVRATASTILQGAVGDNSQRLASLDTTGPVLLSGGAVSTVGAQTYAGPVVVGADTVLAGSTVAFGGTVDGDAEAPTRTLTIQGAAILGDSPGDFIGREVALESLAVDGSVRFGAGNLEADTVRTSGGQTYAGATTLADSTTLTSLAGGDIAFQATVDADPSASGPDLTVNTAGTTIFSGNIGSARPLGALTTDDNLTDSTTLCVDVVDVRQLIVPDLSVLGGAVTSLEPVVFTRDLLLCRDTALSAPSVTFGGGIQGTGSGTDGLTVSVAPGGVAQFAGPVGGEVDRALESLAVNGDAILAGGGVTTAGDQIYSGAVLLADNAALVGNGAVFGGSIAGNGHDLTLAFAEDVSLNGTTMVGLGSLAVSGSGRTLLSGALTTVGGQTYGNDLVLGSDAILSSTTGGDISFGGSVNAAPGSYALTVDTAGSTRFNGDIGDQGWLRSLTTAGGGTTTFNDPAGNTVQTVGDQVYSDAVVLEANTILVSDSGNVTFANTVDGTSALDVRSPGATTFGGAIGALDPLQTLTTDAAGSTVIAGASIQTVAAQTYNDPVVLDADTSLTGTIPTFGGGVTGGAAHHSLTLDFSGDTPIDGAAFADLGDLSSVGGGRTLLRGNLATFGAQTYEDAVSLGSDTTLSGTAITFAETVAGQGYSLTLNSAGTTVLAGAVTGLDALTTDAPGTTTLRGGSITTAGAQTYGDALNLGANTTLASTSSGDIVFGGTIDSETTTRVDLTVNTAGSTVFEGNIGANRPLRDLTTDDNTTDQTTLCVDVEVRRLTVPDLATLGGTLNSEDPLAFTRRMILCQDAVISAPSVTFGLGLDGMADGTEGLAITLEQGGTLTFGGPVGSEANRALEFLTVNGDVLLSGGGVTTVGAQTYAGTLTLGGDSVLTAGSANLGTLVGGGHDLTINSLGEVLLAGAVSDLGNLTTDTGGSTLISGGVVSTAGEQSYGDAVRLGMNTTLSGTGGAFTLGMAGAGYDLTLDFSGVTAIPGDLFTGVNNLVSAGGGITRLEGTLVTSGTQTYRDAVELQGDSTLVGAGAITIESDLDGEGNNLTINTTGTTSLQGLVDNVGVLTTDAGGTTQISSGRVNTTGAQNYGDPVVLGADTTLQGEGVTLNAGLEGQGHDLDLADQGVTVLRGVLEGIGDLTTDTLGVTTLEAPTLGTSGSQIYQDTLRLGADASLIAAGIELLGPIEGQGNDLNLSVGSDGVTLAGTSSDLGTLRVLTPGRVVQYAGAIRANQIQIDSGASAAGAERPIYLPSPNNAIPLQNFDPARDIAAQSWLVQIGGTTFTEEGSFTPVVESTRGIAGLLSYLVLVEEMAEFGLELEMLSEDRPPLGVRPGDLYMIGLRALGEERQKNVELPEKL